MDLAQLADLGEFIGGTAVLVTLIYLAVQVRHTRVQQDAQLLTFALQTTYAASEPAFYSGNMQRLATALNDPEALPEEHQFETYAMLQRQLAGIALLARSDDPVAHAMIAEYKGLFETPGGRAWLAEYPNERFKKLAREAFRRVDDEV